MRALDTTEILQVSGSVKIESMSDTALYINVVSTGIVGSMFTLSGGVIGGAAAGLYLDESPLILIAGFLMGMCIAQDFFLKTQMGMEGMASFDEYRRRLKF